MSRNATNGDSKSTPGSSDDVMSSWELYEATGDSAAALRSLPTESASPSVEYNRRLLQAISGTSKLDLQSMASSLGDLEAKVLQPSPPPGASRKRRRNEFTCAYNRALILLAQGQPQASVRTVWNLLSPLVSSTQSISDELVPVACRLALVLLEGLIILSAGDPSSLPPDWTVLLLDGTKASNNNNAPFPPLDQFIDWLARNIDGNSTEAVQLKFNLSLYTARLDMLHRDNHGKLVDAKIRSARKELKQAMEIFQQKLKTSGGDGGSLASSVSGSVQQPGGGSGDPTNNSSGPSSYPLPGIGAQVFEQGMNRVVQRHYQGVLNVKANAEQLKGNVKKSLILCGQAQAAVVPESDDNNSNSNTTTLPYDVIHHNNLAVVYKTSDKPSLALHAWSKALALVKAGGFESDGSLRVDETFTILHNAAIGSLQAKNFLSAYECMGICLQHSDVWSGRPRSWIRLGEACLGLWSQHPTVQLEGCGFRKIDMEGYSPGVVFSSKFHDVGAQVDLSPTLATDNDMEQVRKNPLPRACFAYEHALTLLEEQKEESLMCIIEMVSARLSLAYIHLEQRNYHAAMEHAEFVHEQVEPEEVTKVKSLSNLFQRQQATARLYAAEAACGLGDSLQSMKFLVGDGKSDAFDRLASALSGVTMETAASNSEGKRRLAKAQAMVRCSASAASGRLGNLAAAKQLAMSAQAMSREGSYAKRALVYCMLREGNCGAALSLLRSAR